MFYGNKVKSGKQWWQHIRIMKVRTVGGSTNINGDLTVAVQTGIAALASNDYRKSFTINNMATKKLYVTLGSTCTASSFHFVLPGGGSDSDGNGGSLSVDGYKGPVTVLGTGTGGYTVVEFI